MQRKEKTQEYRKEEENREEGRGLYLRHQKRESKLLQQIRNAKKPCGMRGLGVRGELLGGMGGIWDGKEEGGGGGRGIRKELGE